MNKIYAIILAILAACSSPERLSVAESGITGGWAMHTLFSGHAGADGAQIYGGNIVVGWEQAGIVTSTPLSGAPTTVITGTSGVEDAKAGPTGIAAASDGASRLYFVPTGGSATTVASSLGHGRWMQVAWADIDGDGLEDIVAGSRTTGAVVAWFKAPTWTYTKMSDAGWTMSLLPLDIDGDGDLDVFLTDRAKIGTSWALYGARWLENQGAGSVWVNHQISVAGSCATCTPGDMMLASLVDFTGDGVLDIAECQSSLTKPNRVVLRANNGSWSAFGTQVLPNPTFAHGHCQHVATDDLDLDGDLDVLVSTWEANALPPSAASGVYVLENTGGGTYVAQDISGPSGTKYDNMVIFDIDGDGDRDVVTTEQVEDLGLIWYENPRL